MTVTAVASSQTTTARQTLAGNFDTFLKLLTTQLKQQDPLAPMDSTQFTSQLVQYASVEQAISTNKQLEDLTALTRASSTASALGMLGHDVTVTGSEIELGAEGGAEIAYELPAAAESVYVSVLDASGKVVFTANGGTAAGANTLAWNGIGSDNERAAAGTYRVKVDAVGTDGAKLAVEQTLAGRVDGIETQDGEVKLFIGGITVPLSAVRDVRRAA